MQSTVFTVYVPIRYKAVASQMGVFYRTRQQSDDDATGVEMCQNKDYPQLWESKQVNIPAADGVEYVYFYMMFQKMSTVMGLFKPDITTYEKADRELNFCFDPLDIFEHPDAKYSHDNDMLQGCWAYIQFYNLNLCQSDLKTKLIALSDSKILEYFKKFYSAYSHYSYVMADLPKLMTNTSQKMFLVFILVKCLPVNSLNNSCYFDKSLAKVCCAAFTEADICHFPSQSNALLKDVVLFLCRTAFGGTNPFAVVKYFYKCLTMDDCSTLIKNTFYHTQTSIEIGDCFQVLISELRKGVEKGKIICLLLLEQIASFESILTISDTLSRVADIPSPFRDAIMAHIMKCSTERAAKSIAAYHVRTKDCMKELKTLVCKIVHTELQTGLSEKLENKVLDIVKERRCEWDRSEIESLHFILLESFLFQGDSVTEVYREIVRSSHSSTQIIFLDILKKTDIITVGVSEVCINWLKKAVNSSRQKHTNREKRVCEMYLSIGSLLEVKSIEDDSKLSSDLEKIVKSEVDKVDIKILMSAAEYIEKIPKKGKELYNLHLQERVLMYEDKFKHGNLNEHLETALGSSNEIRLDLHSHYSYLQVMLSKVPLHHIQDTSKISHDISTVVDIIENITFWYKLFRCKGSYSDKIKLHQSARNVVEILQNVMHNIETQTTSVLFANKILELLKKMDSNEREKLCIIIEITDVPTLDKVLQQLEYMLKEVGDKLACISDLLDWLVKYEGAECLNNSRLHIEGLDVQCEQFKELSKSVLASLEYKLCDIEQAMGLQDQWYLSDAIQIKKFLHLHSFHQFLLHCFLTDTHVIKEKLNDVNIEATHIGDDEEVSISTREKDKDLHPEEDLIEMKIDFDLDEGGLDVSGDDIDMDNNLDDMQETGYKSTETLNMTSKSVSFQVQTLIEIISKSYVPKYMDFLKENVFSESEVHVCDVQFLFLKCTREIELQYLSNMIGAALPERTTNFVRYLQEYDDILRKASEFVRLCNVFDLKTNEDKSTLMCAIREIIDMNENKDSMTVKMLWRSMKKFENLTSGIDDDIWDILHELSKSSSLIKFLRSVMNEDLRNLIDAVEEHSEQFVQESTVSDLIQMTSLLKPILSKDIPESLDKLVQDLLTCFSSRKKGIPQMINNCSLNCNGLKALYMNVANRGEVTKEIVMKILKKGVVRFNIENDKLMSCIHYRTTDSQINYNITDLNDLRSRVLLISNTEGPDENQTDTNKGYLGHFVQICDLVVDISLLLENLHALGHFAFQKYHYESTQIETNKRIQELMNLLTETEVVQSTWQHELAEVQSQFYYMNFIHSKQICILNDYFTSEKHKDEALSILKYIKPTLDIEKTMDTTFEHGAGLANIQFQLERLAAAIHFRISNIPDVYIPFPEDENFVKQIENVDAKVNQGEVYVAHIDVKCTDTIPILLALYVNTTKLFPLPSQVLFCDEQTTWEEIQLLINRCVLRPEKYKDNLFCIVGVEKLPYEIQYHLVQCLKDLERDNISSRKDFLLAILCCAVSHNNFLTSLSSNVHQAPSIGSHAMKTCLQKAGEHTYMITSDLPGQGKTEQVHKLASELSCGVNTISISGPVTKEKLVQLVKGAIPGDSCVLHLDIGPVDQTNLVDNFIFELLILKCATAGTTCVHLQSRYVAIEVSNTLNNTLSDSLNVCSSFQRKHLTWQNFTNFVISQEPESAVQTVCQYLFAKELDTIGEKEIKVSGSDVKPLSSEQCQRLLDDFFANEKELSFSVVDVFLGVLADQLRKLSSSQYFKIGCLTAMLGDEKSMKTVRNDMVKTLITVSKEFSCRSISTCREIQNTALGLVKSSVKTETDAMLSRVEGMIQWSESNHLLVLFQSQDNQTVSSLYRELSEVPADVKKLIETQTRKKLPDLGKFSQEDLQNMLEKLVCQSRDVEVRNRLGHLFKSYALTPDNILKMVLVILRIRTGIPVILMGETGCGKTTLVKYLAFTCGVNLEVFGFHAGITENTVMKKISNWNEEANRNKTKEHWLFLDEINTCDHLGILKEVICHKSCGKNQLASNVAVIAACNPYRLREQNEIFTAGLEGKTLSDEFSKLVYRVHPLPEAMIDYIWDYGTLHKTDEESYIQRMVQIVSENEKNRNNIAKMIAYSQEFIRKTERNASSVSLRDVNRCKTLIVWFLDFFKARNEFSKDTGGKKSRDFTWRAVVMSLSHCYEVRLNNEDKRKTYWDGLGRFFKEEDASSTCRTMVRKEQMDILNRMIIPDGIAKNTALRENVFVLFVCIMNRIPAFLVGKPGCSKSLSVQLLKSNLRGADSDDEFFKTLPQLYVVSYQGSESSTSDGIIKVFEKAEKYKKHNTNTNILPVVLLDEVGLAEISHFNPLKVLHSLLEPSTGEYPEVAVVGISNWALDAAKMNRAIHLSRPDLTNSELFDTAIAIQDGLDTNSHVPKDLLHCLAQAYFEYQKSQPVENFHGLRDYYSLIKYMCMNYPSPNEAEYNKRSEKKFWWSQGQ